MARKRAWHKADIKAEVEKTVGKSLAQIDRENGLPIGTCSDSLRQPNPRGEAVIARLLRREPAELFPDRYHSDGSRKRPQPLEAYRAKATKPGHRQKEARA